MKKIAVIIIMLPVLFAGTSCKKNIKAERIGMVNFMAGTVTIIDGDRKAPAKVGDRVTMGMVIETGAASFVDIYFQENAVKILEKSRVKVSDLAVDLKNEAEKTGFHVSQGKVFVKVAKKLAKNDEFIVSTPTATAGVRGTEFLVTEDNGKSLIACVDGTVKVASEVVPGKDTVMVPEDKEVTVEKDKALTVKDISAENRKYIEDIKRDFQEMKASLREEFEKQRAEIRKAVEDQKKQNEDMIREQKELDKKNVEDQKAQDKANIDAIRGSTSGTGSEAQQGVDSEKSQGSRTVDSVKQKVETYDTKIDK
jgi:hypothetical protein